MGGSYEASGGHPRVLDGLGAAQPLPQHPTHLPLPAAGGGALAGGAGRDRRRRRHDHPPSRLPGPYSAATSKLDQPAAPQRGQRSDADRRHHAGLRKGDKGAVGLVTDTPWGLKPHGFSGYARPNGPRSRLKGVPPPTRTLHASPGERGSITSGSSAWHLVQDAFVLLPVGTTHHGTPKYDSVGKVQDVLPSILAQGEGPGNATRLRAKATQTRLSAWVRNPAACDGLFFCHATGGGSAGRSPRRREAVRDRRSSLDLLVFAVALMRAPGGGHRAQSWSLSESRRATHVFCGVLRILVDELLPRDPESLGE